MMGIFLKNIRQFLFFFCFVLSYHDKDLNSPFPKTCMWYSPGIERTNKQKNWFEYVKRCCLIHKFLTLIADYYVCMALFLLLLPFFSAIYCVWAFFAFKLLILFAYIDSQHYLLHFSFSIVFCIVQIEAFFLYCFCADHIYCGEKSHVIVYKITRDAIYNIKSWI